MIYDKEYLIMVKFIVFINFLALKVFNVICLEIKITELFINFSIQQIKTTSSNLFLMFNVTKRKNVGTINSKSCKWMHNSDLPVQKHECGKFELLKLRMLMNDWIIALPFCNCAVCCFYGIFLSALEIYTCNAKDKYLSLSANCFEMINKF